MPEITILDGAESVPKSRTRGMSPFMEAVRERLAELKDGEVLRVKAEPGLSQEQLSGRIRYARRGGFTTCTRTTPDGVFGYIWRP